MLEIMESLGLPKGFVILDMFFLLVVVLAGSLVFLIKLRRSLASGNTSISETLVSELHQVLLFALVVAGVFSMMIALQIFLITLENHIF
jgi:hypothetical protein